MDFRILGPLEVRDADRVLPIGAGKQRALVALLLVNANRTVASERIVDELWGEQVPESASKMVQVYVSQLRKVLPGEVLRTRPPGYVVELEPDQLDLHRFERLVAAGRDQLAQGAAERASALFTEALSMWRGLALAEFASEPFATPEGARLEELQARRARGPDRGRLGLRSRERGRRRTRIADRPAPAARAPASPPDARAVPIGSPGGGARGRPGRAAHARGRARPRALARPARAAAPDPGPRPGARGHGGAPRAHRRPFRRRATHAAATSRSPTRSPATARSITGISFTEVAGDGRMFTVELGSAPTAA